MNEDTLFTGPLKASRSRDLRLETAKKSEGSHYEI